MLCQQTSPKRSFAHVNMTSYRDVTNNVYLVTMTTMGLRVHPITQSPRASLDLCTPLTATTNILVQLLVFVGGPNFMSSVVSVLCLLPACCSYDWLPRVLKFSLAICHSLILLLF